MTTPLEPELTDELLSAYIDNAVTPEEREFVEQAVAGDAEVAWRLQSLQMTVQLLHEMPALALPRSFMLTPEQVSKQAAGQFDADPVPVAQSPAPRQQQQQTQPGFWARLGEGWRTFWQNGSPALRNAMATSLVLLFVFLAVPRLMADAPGSVAMAPAAEMAEFSSSDTPTISEVVDQGNDAQAAAEVSAADTANNAEPASAATPGPPVAAGNAAPGAAPQTGESAETPSVAAQKVAPGPAAAPAAELDMAADETAAYAVAEESAPESVAGADMAAAAAPMSEAAAPPMLAEAAPMAMGVMSADAPLDQSPAQNADPLTAARLASPAAASDGAGQSRRELAAPAMAAAPAPASPLPTLPPTATSAPTQTPTAAPTETPILTPSATQRDAPTVASVARAPDSRTLSPSPVQSVTPSSPLSALPWLPLAQIAAGAGCLLFGLLWWRSRR